MDAKELRQKTIEELRTLEVETRSKLQDLEFRITTHQIKKVRDLRRLKRELARTLTIIAEMAYKETNKV
ncbi:MAG: 50S ribosomal protein L29 [Patescibacteria group bacterium]